MLAEWTKAKEDKKKKKPAQIQTIIDGSVGETVERKNRDEPEWSEREKEKELRRHFYQYLHFCYNTMIKDWPYQGSRRHSQLNDSLGTVNNRG